MTKNTIAELKKIDSQFGEKPGFLKGFVEVLITQGHAEAKIMDLIKSYLDTSRSLRMQLFGISHELETLK